MIEPAILSDMPSACGRNHQGRRLRLRQRYGVRQSFNLKMPTAYLKRVEPALIERDGVLTPAQSALCNQPI
jgi:hypothetical protein